MCYSPLDFWMDHVARSSGLLARCRAFPEHWITRWRPGWSQWPGGSVLQTSKAIGPADIRLAFASSTSQSASACVTDLPLIAHKPRGQCFTTFPLHLRHTITVFRGRESVIGRCEVLLHVSSECSVVVGTCRGGSWRVFKLLLTCCVAG